MAVRSASRTFGSAMVGLGLCLSVAGLVLASGATPAGAQAVATPAVATQPVATQPVATPDGPAAGPSVVSSGTAGGFAVEATPCSAPTGSTTCATEPTGIEASWPFLSGVDGIEVTWSPGPARPAAAPAPTQRTVALAASDGSCNGTGTECSWPWPTLLEPSSAATVLNGTYQVVACGALPFAPACSTGTGFQPAGLSLGAPPAAPTAVRASVGPGGVVALTWPTGPEVDLAGYEVTTTAAGGGTRLVKACTLNGAPARSTPSSGACASPPSAADGPGAGSWTYDVTALRYGTDGTAATLVASAPTPVQATVSTAAAAAGAAGATGPSAGGTAPAGSTGVAGGSGAAPAGSPATAGATGAAAQSSGAGGGAFELPAVPVLPSTAQSTPLSEAPPSSGATPVVPTAVVAVPAFSPALPFKVGSTDQPVAVATAGDRAPRPQRGVPAGTGGWAAIGAGLLALAAAAHLLYLRGAIGRYRQRRPTPIPSGPSLI